MAEKIVIQILQFSTSAEKYSNQQKLLSSLIWTIQIDILEYQSINKISPIKYATASSDKRLRVLFACFPTKFIGIFRKIPRNKKLVATWFKQATAYFLTYFLLFIIFLVIKYYLLDNNLVFETVTKLIKIFGF